MNNTLRTPSSDKDIFYLRIFTLFFFFGLVTTQGQSQTNLNIELSVGALYSHAPTLSFDRFSGTGNGINVFGDLLINDKIIGRLQYSSLQASTLSSELSGFVDSGYGFAGSGGYNFLAGSNSKLRVPIMLTAAFAQITRSNNFTEQGMQLGLTLAPEYEIMAGLSATLSLRYLKGLEVARGSAIDITDIGLGIKYTFLR